MPSKEVVRKIKSEVLQGKSRNPDIVWDILLLQREKSGVIYKKDISASGNLFVFSRTIKSSLQTQ